MCNEGAIDHVPKLFVVLQFLIDYRIDDSTAFGHGETSKFCKNIRDCHIVLLTNPFDVFYDLLDHVFIIISKGEGLLHWKSATNIDRVESVADFLHLTILKNKATQL